MPLPSATETTQTHTENNTTETKDESPDIDMMIEVFMTLSIAPIFLIILTSSLAFMGQQLSIYHIVGIPLLSITTLASTIFFIGYKTDYNPSEEENPGLPSVILGMTLLTFLAVITLLDYTFLTEIGSITGQQTVASIRELYILTLLSVSLPTGFLLGKINQKNPYITSILTALVSMILLQLFFAV